MDSKVNKIKFLRNWTLLNAAFFIIGYLLVVIFGFLIMEAIHLPKDEWGSPLLQTTWKMVDGILIGISIGYIQWRLLRRTYSIPSFWIYLVPAGILLTEFIVGIFLWRMGINRGEFSFWENNPLPHALIAAIYGFVIGLLQLSILRKTFFKSSYWIGANTLAWGVSILITSINVRNDTILLISFIVGILLYGVITGAALIWILKPKEME